MSLLEKLKAHKPKEKTVTVEGDDYLVVGLGRVRKNALLNDSQLKGKLDGATLESNLLAACVCDPSTREPLMPLPGEWDIPSHIAAPLVAACIEVLGLDSDESKVLEKKSEETPA